MFRKFLSFFLLSLFVLPSAFAYRDVPQNSKSYPAVQNLIEKGYFEDGSFFRPDEPVPADMFWEIVLKFSGFDAESATFDTPLPPGVSESGPMAQYLREAVRRGFLSDIVPYDGLETTSRLQAVRLLNKIKGIMEPQRVSNLFMGRVEGVSQSFKGLPAFEAAYASGFLTDSDIDPLRPHYPLTRRELAEWIFNYEQGGQKKESSVDPEYQPTRIFTPKYPYQRRLEQQQEEEGGTGKSVRISIGNDEDIQLNKQDTSSIMLPDEAILKSVYSHVLKKYRFQTELTDAKKEQMINAAIAGMVKALDDKYSSYIEPEQADDFNDNLSGNFEGIGAYVEMVDDKFTITAPIKGSPAEAAGLMPGDVVLKVDGDFIDNLSVNEIVKKIKGPAGTQVVLTVKRDTGSFDYTITRGKITVPSVTIEFKDGIPIIAINQFSRTTARDFGKIWREEALPKKPRGLVIDLRNNPGGFLTSAVDMGEFFLKKDQLIFTVDQKTLEKRYVSSRNGELSSFENIVVLVNKGSASASEIVAGMLQDYGKAKIVGSRTVGKGTVQEIVNYQNGGMLKITVAKWLTPQGRWIQEDEENPGLVPDVVVEDQTVEERRAKIDKPLDRAINVLLGR